MVKKSGKLKIINELDPSKNLINHDDITKFLSDFDHTYMDKTRPKGPDYFIIDDFSSYFAEGMDLL